MKRLLIIIIIGFLGCGSSNTVYLCNGPQSKAYHKISYCQGLRRCSTDIETVDIATAKAKNRKACRYCF